MSDLTVLIDAAPASPAENALQVQVIWDDAPPQFSPQAAEFIETRWAAHMAQATANGRTLFNGPITRLIEARCEGDQAFLRLAPGDYKSFVVSCLRDHAWFAAHAPQAAVRALGNSVLLTRGSEAFLGIRSPQVSAYPGRAHLIGGVLDLLATANLPASEEGLISHLRQELHEEAGVEPPDLAPAGPRFLGVVQDEFLHQPEALWQWELVTPLEKIGRRLQATEHQGWLAAPRHNLPPDLHNRMTPVARHVWHLWSNASSPLPASPS